MQMTGFNSPNYTQTPNDLFDSIMKRLSESELKVAMAIVRKTFGYHKKYDAVSLSQLEEMTGLSRSACSVGVSSLIAMGLVKIVGTGKRGVSIYELVVNSYQSEIATSQTADYTEIATSTGSNLLPTKEKVKKEKKNKDSAPVGATQHLPDHQDSSPVVAEPPKRTTRSESKQTIPAGQMNPMKDAIAAAFGWEWSTMTKTNIGMIQKVARELCEAGYAPADVAGIYQHCKNQKFDTFTPVALTKHAADWKTKAKQAEARRQPAARPVQAQTEQGEDFYTTRAFIQRTLLRTPVEKRRESPQIWRNGVSDAYLKANGLVWDDVNVMPVPATRGEAR
jgi:phage replication O-like protein O